MKIVVHDVLLPPNEAISGTPARLLRAMAICCLFVFTLGCTQYDLDAGFQDRTSTLFDAVYKEVAEIHIDRVNLASFTGHGLDGFGKVAPDLSVELEPISLSLRREGDDEIEIEHSVPSDAFDWRSWSYVGQRALFSALEKGLIPRDLSEERIHELYFDGALTDLDRYSRYADPSSAEELRAEREGFGGIGVELEGHPDGARITLVVPENPAAAAGLHVDDRLVAINGRNLSGLPIRQVQRLLRGPVDQAVIVTIQRRGVPEPLEVTVGRTRIVPNTVFYSRMASFALIRISTFNERTSKRVAEAVAQARTEMGNGLRGLVLDLRGNPGGLLDQAVDTADLFLEEGLISRADGRHPKSHQVFHAEPGDIADGLPIVVLINGASASAAEILAAALQDHERAIVIGMSSFGKGSIQTVAELPNGGELFITWATFVAPSGYSLNQLGVMPSICTSRAKDAVEVVDLALSETSARNGRNLLKARQSVDPNDPVAVQEISEICPWYPHSSGDIDLAVAELLILSPSSMRRALALLGAGGGR